MVTGCDQGMCALGRHLVIIQDGDWYEQLAGASKDDIDGSHHIEKQ